MRKRNSSGTPETKITATITYRKEPGITYARIFSAQGGKHERSSVSMKETADLLTFEIRANDVAAMAASANSILRALQIIEATKP